MDTSKHKAGEDDPAFANMGIYSLADLPLINGTDRHIKGLYRLRESGKLVISVSVSHDRGERLESFWGLTRLTAKGERDEDFATKGLLYEQFKPGLDATGGKVTMHGSRIYVQCTTALESDLAEPPQHLALGCCDESGKLVDDFANKGKLILHNREKENCIHDKCNIAVQTDGKIILSATYNTSNAPGRKHAALFRVNEKGVLDTSFATDGRLDITLGTSVKVATVNALHLCESGKFLIAGDLEVSGKTRGFIARLNKNGSRDTTFGSVATPGYFELADEYGDTSVQSLTVKDEENHDGSFFALGHAKRGKKVEGLVVKMQQGGRPDLIFNKGEPLLTQLDKENGDSWGAGFVDSENRITVAGSVRRIYIARYDHTGTRDQGFGLNGFLIKDYSALPSMFLQRRGNGKFIYAANVSGIGGYIGQLLAFLG